MQIIFFGGVVLIALVLNILTSQGFFNVKDKLLWKQTANLLSQQQPATIEIKSAKVQSNIERVGIDKDGKMQAPTSAGIVSWYQFGALPGEKGNMVLSGHKDSPYGPGIFYTLGNVSPNDEIIITDASKKTFTYKATAVNEYYSEKLPVSKIFSEQDNEKKIYLITCAGDFNFFAKRYDKRILVEGKASL